MDLPDDLMYSREHIWIRIDGDSITLGITDYAQDRLGEIEEVELPADGEEVVLGDVFGTIESAETTSELISPVTGEVIERNEDVIEDPGLINDDPYYKGWLITVKIYEPDELNSLMSAAEYDEYLQNL